MKMAMMWLKLRMFNVADAGGGHAAAPAAGEQTAPPAGDATAEVTPPAAGAAGAEAVEGQGTADDGGQLADPADTVPEGDYAFELPEGMQPDTELLTALTPTLKELGMTQKQAGVLVGAYAQHVAAQAAAQSAAWEETVTGWEASTKADKEIGGANFDAATADANLAIEKFGSPELREYFDTYGVGSHPEMIRFAARIGQLVKEDNPANSNGAGTSDTISAKAARMFPSSTKKG